MNEKEQNVYNPWVQAEIKVSCVFCQLSLRTPPPPVVHLPQLRPHPHLPHAHQPFAAAADHLPVVRLHRGDAQVVGVQERHGGAGSQVEHRHPESGTSETLVYSRGKHGTSKRALRKEEK